MRLVIEILNHENEIILIFGEFLILLNQIDYKYGFNFLIL